MIRRKTTVVELVYEARTDVGRKRANNEDAFAVNEAHHIYVVCDGMGGHASGEVASSIATDSLLNFYTQTCRANDFEWPNPRPAHIPFEEHALQEGILNANQRIHEEAANDTQLEGMGTTVCAIAAGDQNLFLAHVGDSRIYRYRGGQLSLLTEDHSLINHYKNKPDVSQAEMDAIKGRSNVIVRALGLREDLEVDLRVEQKRSGDIYLLCTDGLTDLVSDTEIEDVFRQNPQNLQAITSELIDESNARGGKDNITVLLLELLPGNPDVEGSDRNGDDADTLRDFPIDHSEFDNGQPENGLADTVRPPRHRSSDQSGNIVVASGTVDFSEQTNKGVTRNATTVTKSNKTKKAVALVPPPVKPEGTSTQNTKTSERRARAVSETESAHARQIEIRDPDLREIVFRATPTAHEPGESE